MKHAWVIFILLLLLWLVGGLMLLTHTSPASFEVKHAKHEKMDVGGPGTDRHEATLVYGWLLGITTLLIFVTLLAFGARRPEGLGRMNYAFIAGGILYVTVFAALMISYQDSLHSAEPAFMGPFPASASLVFWGMYGVPYFFVILYSVTFNRWFLTPADMERFQEILEKRRMKDEG